MRASAQCLCRVGTEGLGSKRHRTSDQLDVGVRKETSLAGASEKLVLPFTFGEVNEFVLDMLRWRSLWK